MRRRDDLNSTRRARPVHRPSWWPRARAASSRNIEDTEALTARNRRMTLTFAFNYGGRAELTDAVRAIADEVAAEAHRPEAHRRADDRAPPLRARHARPRPHRAHVGRVPHLELPDVAGGVLGARVHRRALARLPPSEPLRRRSASSSAATAASAPSTTTESSRSERADGAGKLHSCNHAVPGSGCRPAQHQAGGDRPHRHHPDPGARQDPRRRQGRPQAGEPLRRAARAHHPCRVPVLPGPQRPRRRHPGRDHRRQPRAPGALRLPHPRGLDARSHRPGRPGSRAQRRAVPDARGRAAHARRRAQRRW